MKNISTRLFTVAVFSLIPLQNLMAWNGYIVDKGEDFNVIDYEHKGNGEGEITYSDGAGKLHKGFLTLYSFRPGEDLYGELTEYDTEQTYDVVMDKNKNN